MVYTKKDKPKTQELIKGIQVMRKNVSNRLEELEK
jgi:hypothetical protein